MEIKFTEGDLFLEDNTQTLYRFSDSEEYKKFIKGYYFGHDELNQLNQDTINEVVSKQEQKDKKPWWKFW